METNEIAKRLYAYCAKGDWLGAQNELYAESATSTEPFATPGFDVQTKGLDAIRTKGEKFDSMVEKVHSIQVSEPIVAGNAIAFSLRMDLTMKDGNRMDSPELCLYKVQDGKIISEEFYF